MKGSSVTESVGTRTETALKIKTRLPLKQQALLLHTHHFFISLIQEYSSWRMKDRRTPCLWDRVTDSLRLDTWLASTDTLQEKTRKEKKSIFHPETLGS